ncbi:MIP family Ig-specific serine endopeptidase [Mycoplasmopsis alligatoris]|uniref:Lipoprotein n=1 Tax=Mycoplasmopsis alligatoris A21JP2 TaxID=747682 RepID=D4XWF8_9BACT|nr:lipoprotein 17-related variable surface protein [Mycoplasmopsis alligatoris]EFF41120.1 conserved hypothetical protein [Mycoplasmopsis alligatoris A21JP2]
MKFKLSKLLLGTACIIAAPLLAIACNSATKTENNKTENNTGSKPKDPVNKPNTPAGNTVDKQLSVSQKIEKYANEDKVRKNEFSVLPSEIFVFDLPGILTTYSKLINEKVASKIDFKNIKPDNLTGTLSLDMEITLDTTGDKITKHFVVDGFKKQAITTQENLKNVMDNYVKFYGNDDSFFTLNDKNVRKSSEVKGSEVTKENLKNYFEFSPKFLHINELKSELVSVKEKADKKGTLEVEYKTTYKDFSTTNKFDIEGFKNGDSAFSPTLNDRDVYQLIHDREFSLGIISKRKGPKNPADPSEGLIDVDSPVFGTGWLLDYEKNDSSEFYNLFIATNVHVAVNVVNKKDNKSSNGKFDYIPAANNPESVGFALGRSSQIVPYSLKNTDKMYGPQPVYYGNSPVPQILTTPLYQTGGYNEVKKSLFELPTTVFMGYDTYKESGEYFKAMNTYFKTKASRSQDPRGELVGIDKQTIKPFRDFAVLNLKVNKKVLEEYPELKEWILKAIKSVDKTVEWFKAFKTYNNENKNAYMSKDYLSVENETDDTKKKLGKFVVAGYPSLGLSLSGQGHQPFNFNKLVWVQNNVVDSDDKRYSSIGNNTVEGGRNSAVFNAPSGFFSRNNKNEWIHVTGASPKAIETSLEGGASGSLVMNEYGLPTGIYFGSAVSFGAIELFVQHNDIQIDMKEFGAENSNPTKYILPKYNLIEGSEANGYKDQKTSYKENLKEIYKSQSGFTTALFGKL